MLNMPTAFPKKSKENKIKISELAQESQIQNAINFINIIFDAHSENEIKVRLINIKKRRSLMLQESTTEPLVVPLLEKQ